MHRLEERRPDEEHAGERARDEREDLRVLVRLLGRGTHADFAAAAAAAVAADAARRAAHVHRGRRRFDRRDALDALDALQPHAAARRAARVVVVPVVPGRGGDREWMRSRFERAGGRPDAARLRMDAMRSKLVVILICPVL